MNIHILNGDALKEQFPKTISGEIIITRECLVDGDIQGDTLEALFATRARFIDSYEGVSEGDYFKKAIPEFEKIKAISDDAEIYLWFEDDLFCQVNLWFIIHLLSEYGKTNPVYLVRPTTGMEFGFGGMNENELIIAFQQKMQITTTEFQKLSRFWKLYQHNQCEDLLRIAEELGSKYVFLKPAIQAHIERIPTNNKPGRPVQTLLDIMQELKTEHFGTIFIEFCKRESIYGYGDLQVKRLVDELITKG